MISISRDEIYRYIARCETTAQKISILDGRDWKEILLDFSDMASRSTETMLDLLKAELERLQRGEHP